MNYDAIFAVWLIVFIFREIMTWKDIRIPRYLLTPLITLITGSIVVKAMVTEHSAASYQIFVLSALALSLVADTLLMIKENNFIHIGIIYFALGHILYIYAFSEGYQFQIWNIIPALALLGVIFVMYRLIKKNAGKFIVFIIIYSILLSGMVFFAAAKINNGISFQSITVLFGAILFMASDIILVSNEYIKPIPHSSVFTWLLYAPAQLLIAASCINY
jgi:uncharacterized membrane protein YhhN